MIPAPCSSRNEPVSRPRNDSATRHGARPRSCRHSVGLSQYQVRPPSGLAWSNRFLGWPWRSRNRSCHQHLDRNAVRQSWPWYTRPVATAHRTGYQGTLPTCQKPDDYWRTFRAPCRGAVFQLVGARLSSVFLITEPLFSRP